MGALTGVTAWQPARATIMVNGNRVERVIKRIGNSSRGDPTQSMRF
jgi:hypothetical protein